MQSCSHTNWNECDDTRRSKPRQKQEKSNINTKAKTVLNRIQKEYIVVGKKKEITGGNHGQE